MVLVPIGLVAAVNINGADAQAAIPSACIAGDFYSGAAGNVNNAATAGCEDASASNSSLYQNVGDGPAHKIFTGVLTSTDISRGYITLSGTGDGNDVCGGGVFFYRGGHATPMGGSTPVHNQVDNSANPNPGAITPPYDNGVVLSFLGAKIDADITSPSGMDDFEFARGNDVNSQSVAICYVTGTIASTPVDIAAFGLSASYANLLTWFIRSNDDLPPPGTGDIWYVDPDLGDNGNTGTSSGDPFETFSAALSAAAHGDSILFARGSSQAGPLTCTKNIAFGAYGTGANPIITGATRTTNGIHIATGVTASVSYIDFYQCASGVIIQGAGARCSIYECNANECFAGYSSGGGAGGGQFVEVENCTATNSVAGAAGDGLQSGDDSDDVEFTITNFTAVGCAAQGLNIKTGTAHVTGLFAYDCGQAGALAQTDGWIYLDQSTVEECNTIGTTWMLGVENASRMYVTRSTIRNADNNGGAGAGQLANIQGAGAVLDIRSSLLASTSSPGGTTSFIGTTGLGTDAATLVLYQNTMLATVGTPILIDTYDDPNLSYDIQNNILVSQNSRIWRGLAAMMVASGSRKFKYNLCLRIAGGDLFDAYDDRQYTAAQVADFVLDTGQGAGNVYADPLFVNAGGYDFRLLPGSPALSAGLAGTGVTEDFDGDTYGSPPNQGAQANAGVVAASGVIATVRGGFLGCVGRLISR